MNYYNNLWTGPAQHGSIFWDKVDFTRDVYQYQEHVFRGYLKTLYTKPPPIRSILELGIGRGRMTKIVMEELGGGWDWPYSLTSLRQYDAVDVNPQVEEIHKSLGHEYTRRISLYNLDITSNDFNLVFAGNHGQYDLILASEVFMHILPKDIDGLISKLTRLLTDKGSILNIDWYEPIASFTSEWCFMHRYEKMYVKYGLNFRYAYNMPYCKQALYHYGLK